MVPAVDVLEDETGITLFADLPGVPRDNLTVRADGDGLLIEGEVVLETPENTTPAYAEVQTLRYRRAFTLSRELDTTKSEECSINHVKKHELQVKTSPNSDDSNAVRHRL